MRVKRFVLVLMFPAVLCWSPVASADFWGGDIPLLIQILANAVQQLTQLRQIFQAGSDQLHLIQDLNRGINDSLQMLRTVSPNTDPGIFRDWQSVSAAVQAVTALYGDVVPSKDSRIQLGADQSVAEAVSLNNAIYNYTRDIDVIGETIKTFSHQASPGGAQKLTAESMGVMLHVMNQSLRAQATSLKIQAEVLALQNHKDKEASRETLEVSRSLKTAIDNETPQFQTPRF